MRGRGEDGAAWRRKRPCRLTPSTASFPRLGPCQVCGVLADGVKVGHIQRGNRCWEARLWNEAGNREGGYADAPVVREYLRELRAELRERVELKGPWWSETAATG